MKKLITGMIILTTCTMAGAQSIGTQIIDGAKTLVDVVKIFKPSPAAASLTNSVGSDLIFRNKTEWTVEVRFLKKKNDTVYTGIPVKLTVSPLSVESLLDVSPGIYRYRVTRKNNGGEELLKEGECRLEMNEKKILWADKP